MMMMRIRGGPKRERQMFAVAAVVVWFSFFESARVKREPSSFVSAFRGMESDWVSS